MHFDPPGYCLFFHRQRVCLGWAWARDTRTWRVSLASGERLRCPPQRILYAWTVASAPKAEGSQHAYKLDGDGPVTAAHQQAEREAVAHLSAEEADLQLRMRALTGESLSRTRLEALRAELPCGVGHPAEALLARLLPTEASHWERAAAVLVLAQERTLFHWGPHGFQAHDAAEAVRRESLRSEESARAEALEQRLEWTRAWGQSPPAQLPQAETAPFVQELLSLTLHERRSPHWRWLAGPLGLNGLEERSLRMRLQTWLECANSWPGWPAIWRMQAQLPHEFSPQALEQAQRLHTKPVELRERTDLRKLPCYTIDDHATRDRDDALSVQSLGRGRLLLSIHIAHPHGLRSGDAIFAEAEARLASSYALSEQIPMLPQVLSEDRYSLQAGVDRETLTMRFRLDEGGVEWLDAMPTVICVRANLNYQQGAQLLTTQRETWGRLAVYCARLRTVRIAAGATEIPRPSLRVDVSYPEQVRLMHAPRDQPIDRLIEESAILYNHHAGMLCADAGLPAIYRTQPAFSAPAATRRSTKEHKTAGGVVDRQAAPRASFSIRPATHVGLACERYIQISAPLRRFLDLLMQAQLSAHLRGLPLPFPLPSKLSGWAQAANQRLSVHRELAARVLRYWKLRYLQQNAQQAFAAYVQEPPKANGKGALWLPALELRVACNFAAPLPAETLLRVRLAEVDPPSGWALLDSRGHADRSRPMCTAS